MLRYLTHKLKTQSLAEENTRSFIKVDDERDSGTESDDENGDSEDDSENMDSDSECSGGRKAGRGFGPSPELTMNGASGKENVRWDNLPMSPVTAHESPIDSALPSDSDLHHSSEEELETINTYGEKRKRSQVESVSVADSSGASSDEEIEGLMCCRQTPVQFRCSPPADAHKPGRCGRGGAKGGPPPKLFHGDSGAATTEVSPRKRYKHANRPHHIQRPCLDFEKMQQLKAKAVSTWRHEGELSLYCMGW